MENKLSRQDCPYCGSAQVSSEFVIKTAEPVQRLYINGVPSQNVKDNNKWVYSVHCASCGKDWFITADVDGKVLEVIDKN